MIQFEAVLIEDNPRIIPTIERKLKELGCIMVGDSPTSEEGFELIKKYKPQLVIIDLHLKDGERKGLKVAHKIRAQFPEMVIIIITASRISPDEIYNNPARINHFVKKSAGTDSASLFAVIKSHLSRISFPIIPADQNKKLTIRLIPNQPIQIIINNQTPNITQKNYQFDAVEGAIDTQELRWITANSNAMQKTFREGKRIYEKLFKGYEEIYNSYLQTKTLKSKQLHLGIASDRGLFSFPFGLMHDGTQYLALKHPFQRILSGNLNRNRQGITPSLFYENSRNPDKAIRILLIASDTGNIPGVDEEVKALAKGFRQKLRYNLTFYVKTLSTEEADYNSVINELESKSYDILHYAGHGKYDNNQTDNCSISFWEEKYRKGRIRELKAQQLSALAADSDLKFVYLSCCAGGQAGDYHKLIDNNFLGLTESLLIAGVPAVLGYRWPVSDKNAIGLAKGFYSSLLQHCHLDRALYDARRSIYYGEHNPIDGLSPILWVQ